MTLGIALLLIFILYLIDKHNLWRKAAKFTIGVVIVATLGAGCLYGWLKYDEHRKEAESAAYQAKMRPLWDCETRNAQFSNAEEECVKDPTVVLSPLKVEQPLTPQQSVHRSSSLHQVKALYNVNLTTQEFGSLVCGHIKAGELVTLLSTGEFGAGVKVKTQDGRIGWGPQNAFEVVDH